MNNLITYRVRGNVDPLIGRVRPDMVFTVPANEVYNLYRIGDAQIGHGHCENDLCLNVIPALARPGNYVLVSADRRTCIIYCKDDFTEELIPATDGGWIRGGHVPVPHGSKSFILDPGEDLLENHRRARQARVAWRMDPRPMTEICDRLTRI